MVSVALVATSLVIAAPRAQAAGAGSPCSVWAATNGSSGASGSESSPLNLQTAVTRLGPDVVLCLKGGTYALPTQPYVNPATSATVQVPILNINAGGTSSAPAVVRSAPGSSVTLRGRVVVNANDVVLSELHVDGTTQTGYEAAALSLNGDRTVLVGSEVEAQTRICINVGIAASGVYADDVVIQGNWIHECGDDRNLAGGTTNHNQEHAIYLDGALRTVVRSNLITDAASRGIQLSPDSDGALVEQNTFHRVWDGFNLGSYIAGMRSTSNTIRGNLFTGVSGYAVNGYWNPTPAPAGETYGNLVERNCFYGTASGAKARYDDYRSQQTKGYAFASSNLWADPGYPAAPSDPSVLSPVGYVLPATSPCYGRGLRSPLPSLPGRPGTPVASPRNGAVSLQWSSPEFDGGTPILEWEVTPYIGSSAQPTRIVSGSATSTVVSGLANGTGYTFRIAAHNQAGTGPASAPSAVVVPDGTAPTATIAKPSTRWNLSTTMPIAWSGQDAGSGVATYDVRRRAGTWNGSLGALSTWRSATTTTTGNYVGTLGATYCWSARAKDIAGNVGSWGTERCSAIPLRSDQLAYSSGWSKVSSSSRYGGFSYSSTTAGAKVTRTGIVAKRIALIATTCPTCGTVEIRWNGVLQKTISLVSTTTTSKKAIELLTFASPTTGTLEVRVKSSGRSVVIEGLGVSKSGS